MKILVTGCAGFIGAHVAKLLLERGNEVVGLDNLNDYYDVRLKEHRLQTLSGQKAFSFWNRDIENQSALREIFRLTCFDAVINLAARAGVRASLSNPHIYLTTNAHGTLNLLELVAEFGVKQFVMASTSSLYAGATVPFSETANVINPISPYAATKLAAEALARTWHHSCGVNVAILRYFTAYGPSGRPDMSPFRFIESIRRGKTVKVYGDGKQTRDFTYIDDVAAATVMALRVTGCETLNIGGGNEPISINEMILSIEESIGRKASITYLEHHPSDMVHTSANITKAKAVLGWQPEVSPRQGFHRTARWHIENSELLDTLFL